MTIHDNHKILVNLCWKYFKERGYKVSFEYAFKKLRADLRVEKGKELLWIECTARPSYRYVLQKIEKYKKIVPKGELVIVFPSHFVPKFPIEEFVRIMKLDVSPGESILVEEGSLVEGEKRPFQFYLNIYRVMLFQRICEKEGKSLQDGVDDLIKKAVEEQEKK